MKVRATPFRFSSKRWRLLLIPFTLFLIYSVFILVSGSYNQTRFTSPNNFQSFSSLVTSGTYQINCDGNWAGSGWGLELESRFFVVTAEHVINDCLDGSSFYARNESVSMFELQLVSYDGRYWLYDYLNYRDLALLETQKQIPTLEFQFSEPEIGQWVAAVGYPGDTDLNLRLSITTGTVTSVGNEGFVVTDAAINGGNSGGPLVNSFGQVVGTVFASEPNDKFENMGFAQGLSLHCVVILECPNGSPTSGLTKDYLSFRFVDEED